MGKYLVAYLAAAIAFVAMDATWLAIMGPRLYKTELAGLFTDAPSIVPAILFYVIYLFGVVYFCVVPALAARRWAPVLRNGIVLALSAYATYDLTNQATLRIWSTKVTVVDLGWGVFVTVVAASVGYFITRRTFKR